MKTIVRRESATDWRSCAENTKGSYETVDSYSGGSELGDCCRNVCELVEAARCETGGNRQPASGKIKRPPSDGVSPRPKSNNHGGGIHRVECRCGDFCS